MIDMLMFHKARSNVQCNSYCYKCMANKLTECSEFQHLPRRLFIKYDCTVNEIVAINVEFTACRLSNVIEPKTVFLNNKHCQRYCTAELISYLLPGLRTGPR